MLELHQVSKTFNPGTINEKKALKNINLHLKPGDFVTVIGGNGAGKSTMLNAVAGVWPVDAGRVLIDGVDVTGMPEHVRAQYIGRVFQDPMTGTAPNMQLEENLALAMRRGRKRGLRWGVTNAEREEYAERLMILGLGLEDRMTVKVGLLSGGLMSQYQGFADINMGRGAIVIGLAAVIIGEVLCDAFFRKGSSFYTRLTFVVLGGVAYYIVMVIVLWLRLNSNDLKLFTAVLVAIFLAVPYLQGQRRSSFRAAAKHAAAAKKGGAGNA